MQNIYLDNAATTPIAPEVIEVMTEAMKEVFGNPSSTHQFGRKAKSLVEASRVNIAKIIGCSTSEIFFTAGGSEADNLILRNAITNLGVTRIISSKIEHHAVLHTLENLKKEFNINLEFIKLNDDSSINIEHLKSLLAQSNEKTLVSLMLVNNEIGTLLPYQEVSKLCLANNSLFHSDSVQAFGHVQLNIKDNPIDFLAASAHKFHGPKGVGFAYVKKGIGIQPMLLGGEQEKGARAGTENVHSILGMEKALSMAFTDFETDKSYILSLKNYFITGLQKLNSEIAFNGVSHLENKSAPHILSVRFPRDISMLLFQLDLKGIAASGGSACQSGSNKGSHVLQEILSLHDSTKTSVRFSFSKYNTKDELDYVLKVLGELIN